MSEYKGTITSKVEVNISGFKWYQSRQLTAEFGNRVCIDDYPSVKTNKVAGWIKPSELEYLEDLEQEIVEHLEEVDNILEGQWIQAMKDLDIEFEWDSAVREYQLKDWMKGENDYEGYNATYIDTKDLILTKTIAELKASELIDARTLVLSAIADNMDDIIEAAEQKLEYMKKKRKRIE